MGSIPEPQSSVEGSTHPFKVLIVGGSYAGLSAALNLQDLCSGLPPRCAPQPKEEDSGAERNERPQFSVDITIVDERDGFYHLIGSPLALASEAYADKCWVRYEDIPALRAAPNIRVLHGSVQAVDVERKTATYVAHGGAQSSTLQYDYFVAAAGLRRAWPVVPQSLRKKQYLFETGDHIRATTAARHGVVIVGGGAVGIEMAAELKLVQPQLRVTLVHSRDKLLSSEPLPDEVKDRSLELLRDAGVDVLMGHRLDRTEEVTDEAGNRCLRVHFTNGHSMLADQVSLAVSRSVPSTTFLPRHVLDDEGYVKIEANLAFAPSHFAVGDLVKWSGIKRCGAAMHMGYFAAHNLHQLMMQATAKTEAEKAPPKFLELDEIPPMIGLAVGKKGVSYWPQGGLSSGEEVMKLFFGDDLGFSICWNHLGLGGKKAV
ncbi:1fd6dbbd-9467-41b6-a320-a38a4d06889a [Thermothielavioides terrestris]|uniref:1fd6dbbd-9467-41b6-a320-a38a4d06889a n=1 Tax=Thermothielavioides terrestris TaxID=2587410 RepID=A0A446BVB7_9PEZI|nr:1fd6dbbd-9467-41b6-a320-a38a4d06889a [Thermothielavioides terrestris]